MGVLAPRLHTLDVSACPPIDTSGNFLAHVSAESPLNISPQPLRSHIQSFGTLGQLLEIPPFVRPNIP